MDAGLLWQIYIKLALGWVWYFLAGYPCILVISWIWYGELHGYVRSLYPISDTYTRQICHGDVSMEYPVTGGNKPAIPIHVCRHTEAFFWIWAYGPVQ